jgi:hypothetical protein
MKGHDVNGFNRADYERVIEIARRLYGTGTTAGERQRLAAELFTMAEDVIGQMPPLVRSDVAQWHELAILCNDWQSRKQAEERLDRWLSTFGHTTSYYGFVFMKPVESTPGPYKLPPNCRDVTATAPPMAIMPFPAGGKKKPE